MLILKVVFFIIREVVELNAFLKDIVKISVDLKHYSSLNIHSAIAYYVFAL